MKITKSKLKQIIKEEYAGQAEDEGHADSYNYGERTPRSDDPEYLKGFEAGLAQKEKESGDDYYDIRKSDLGPDRLEEDDWPDEVKKGRFTSYCKREGFDGPGIGCSEKAMDSKKDSVRGMASFYMNTVKPKGKDASDVAEESQQPTKQTLQEYIKEILAEVTAGAEKFADFDEIVTRFGEDRYNKELAVELESAIDTIISPEMENLGLQDKASSREKQQGITNYSSPSGEPYKSATIDVWDDGNYEVEVYPSTDEEAMQHANPETLMDAINFIRGVLSPQGAVAPAPGEDPAQMELPLQENKNRKIKIRRKKK